MKKNVPKLRFKDENGNVFPEWELKLLSDILFEHKTRNLGNTFSEVFSVAKTKGIINQIEHLGRSFAGQDTGIYKVVFPFDIVYTKSPTSDFPFGIIKQNKLNRSGIVSVLYGVFRPSNQFIGFILDSYFSVWQNTFNCLSPIVQKGAKNTINIGNDAFLQGIRINLPSSLPEQKKIADFLSAIDERIQYLTKKKELLEQYKRGVMQKIFSQKLHFKDESGKPFPKWEKRKLSDITTRITTRNSVNNQNVLTISAQHGLINQLLYFNKSVSSKNLEGYFLLSRDDFAFNKSISSGYPFGAIKRLSLYDAGVVSPLYICFRIVANNDFSFMEYLFESGIQNSEIEQIAHEGARNHGLLNIGISDFFNIRIPLPSLPEQKKIADFLTAIDDKIEHVTRQLEKTMEYKKGLLQQMFV